MTLLPIVERELRAASTRWQTYWGRTLTGLVAVAVAAIGVEQMGLLGSATTPANAAFGGANWMAMAGTGIFTGLAGLALVSAMLSGILYTSDAISKERREGTLGLLFLTDLRGLDVALGKMATNSLGAVYGLAAVQPVFGLTLLLGGVSFTQYLLTTLTLVVIMMASLTAGLLASTFARSARAAIVILLFMGLAVTAFFPTLAWALDLPHGPGGDWEPRTENGLPTLGSLNPLAGFVIIVSNRANLAALELSYWTSIAYTLAVSGICLFWAARRLPRICNDSARPPKFRNLEFVARDRRASKNLKAELLEKNPVAWILARHTTRRLFPWFILLAASLMFGAYPLLDSSYSGFAEGLYVVTGIAHYALALWIASECCHQALEDRRSGAFELTLCTPVSTGEYIRGHLTAVWRMGRLQLAAMIALDVVLMTVAASMPGSSDSVVRQWVARESVFLADLAALAAVSLRAGLIARDGRAVLGAIGCIYAVPWAAALVACGLALAWYSGSTGFINELQLGVFIIICLANDALWITVVCKRLKFEVRSRAVEPVGRRYSANRTQKNLRVGATV